MGIQTIRGEFGAFVKRDKFSMPEKFILRKFHPQNIFFEITGTLWAVYFLWNQDWQNAVLVGAIMSLLGLLSVWNLNDSKMSETTLGKLALLHLNPLNLSVQIVGLAPAVYGVWTHSVEMILIGLSIIFLGHAAGWSKVDSKFSVPKSIN